MMENELYHHGIKGMHWGVRRYQNADGSLTKAGKKRYGTKSNFERVQAAKKAATVGAKKAKAKAKADARTEAEILKYKKKAGLIEEDPKQKKQKDSKTSKPQPKKLSEMSNEEIQAKIDRIRLENTLKSLTPQQKTRGQKFADSMREHALPTAKKMFGDVIEKALKKKLSEALGVDLDASKKAEEYSKKLKNLAADYENRQKIDKGQQYFKEGKYAEKSGKKPKDSGDSGSQNSGSNNSGPNTGSKKDKGNSSESNTTSTKSQNTSSQKTEKYKGTVEGEGQSRSKYADNDKHDSKKDSSYYDPIDADWREVNSSTTSSGRNYIDNLLNGGDQFLLEDKKR